MPIEGALYITRITCTPTKSAALDGETVKAIRSLPAPRQGGLGATGLIRIVHCAASRSDETEAQAKPAQRQSDAQEGGEDEGPPAPSLDEVKAQPDP